jgi:hypothetical protein
MYKTFLLKNHKHNKHSQQMKEILAKNKIHSFT